MYSALDESDELWMRLVWFIRLRWSMAPALVLFPWLIERWTGPLFPLLPMLALLGIVLLVNFGYATLLRRWRADAAGHALELRRMAHVQVLFDLLILSAGTTFVGTEKNPFWPFLSLTVLAAALFFRRRWTIFLYGLAATLMYTGAAALTGGLHAPSVLLLPAFLAMVGLIATYYASRVADAYQATLELERLRAEKTAAEEISRHKDEILSRVSHELRNPLAALRGWVDMAKSRRHGSATLMGGEPMEKTLGRIDAQIDRMTRMVGDLYDLSSARAGMLKIEARPCDLVGLMRELLERFATLYPELQVTLEAPQSMWGNWDPERIDQLATNLVGNAVKYAPRAPITLRITPSSGQSAHLEVIDEGPGIPPDKLPGIFEAFTRASTERASGLGLGLSIAREIVLLHGGAIWVDSKVGQGTTFHVRLPTGGVRPPS